MNIQVEDIWSIDTPSTGPNPGYVGWPTITRQKSGRLTLVYSGGRAHHVCPFGQVHIQHSDDNGKTWTWPRTLVDGPLDDRDAGVLETSKGTLIVNWFTSNCWKTFLEITDPKALKERLEHLPEEEVTQWKLRAKHITDELSAKELGTWCIRSNDGGQTWSNRIDTVAGSPHGPIELSDGSLLYPGKHNTHDLSMMDKGTPLRPQIGAARSTDDGQSWQWLSDITPMQGHESAAYHELHGVQAADGRIVVHIRNHNELHKHDVLQTHSLDGGKTWAPVTNTGLKGYPAFLMRTRAGQLISTFGHRFEPLGNQVAISEDHGQTWSKQMPINTDSQGDIGYPSTTEIDDNVFISLWYDTHGSMNAKQPGLRVARWRIV